MSLSPHPHAAMPEKLSNPELEGNLVSPTGGWEIRKSHFSEYQLRPLGRLQARCSADGWYSAHLSQRDPISCSRRRITPGSPRKRKPKKYRALPSSLRRPMSRAQSRPSTLLSRKRVKSASYPFSGAPTPRTCAVILKWSPSMTTPHIVRSLTHGESPSSAPTMHSGRSPGCIKSSASSTADSSNPQP
jgi:hypothetical protein